MKYVSYKGAVLGLLLTVLFCHCSEKPKAFYKNGDFEVSMTGMIRTESEFDIFTTLLRDNIHDKLFYNRTTIDVNLFTKSAFVNSKITVRDRLIWGNHRIATTDRKYLSTLDAFPTVHAHPMAPNLVWVREAWVEADLSRLGSTNLPKQSLTVGSFSFKLGRGISLGDAYRVNPLSIDFFQDSVVDQYTWGAKLSGEWKEQLFKYDVYVTVLNNQSTSLEETNLPTRVKTFGTSNTSKVRGAGQINYIGAAHCIFSPVKNDLQTLTFDSYIMHFADPEQKVEYLFDAQMSLTTAGFAVEFSTDSFELGFDCASNFGHQYVKAWDRNTILNVDAGGYSGYVYSEVVSVNPLVQTPTETDIVFFDPNNTAQTDAIANVSRGALSNGAPIYGTPFYNSTTRYRDAYTTKFKGHMWVGDARIWLIPKTFALSITWGFASGDRNPNGNILDSSVVVTDQTYNGFVPIQEQYAGSRVQSYFTMASGLVPLLSSTNIDSYFSYGIDTLSNVVFWGTSLRYQQSNQGKQWSAQPNLILYWQDYKKEIFDITTGKTTEKISSPYKGLEANFFVSSQLSESISLGVGFGMFVPGIFFFENKGTPLSPVVAKQLIKALKAGLAIDQLPLLGDNTICSGTVALTYLF